MQSVKTAAPTDYDGLCEAIKDINDEIDGFQWRQGDYICQLYDSYGGKTYGKKLIKALSIDTQISESTLRTRRRMSDFYSPEDRERIQLEYAVNYSVMDIARRAGDMDQVYEFLDYCADKDDITSTRHYEFALARFQGEDEKPKKPEKLGDAVVVAYMEGAACCLEIDDHLTPDWWQAGKMYRIEIWECE